MQNTDNRTDAQAQPDAAPLTKDEALWSALAASQRTDVRLMFQTCGEAQLYATKLRSAGVTCGRDRDCLFVPRRVFEAVS